MSQIGGSVIDGNDKPIPGVLVTLYNPGRVLVSTDTTDQAGEWYFDNAAAENASAFVEFTKPGYLTTDYPAGNVDSIVQLDNSVSLSFASVPVFVWVIIGTLVLFAGYALAKKYKIL